MRAIAQLYTEGDDNHDLLRHQLPVFSDVRGRALGNYEVSKVVDRIKNEHSRCPHTLKDSS